MNQKEFAILIIITFIVAMIWIIADIAHLKATVSVDQKLQQLLTPLTPTFDTNTLNQVRQSVNNKHQAQTKAVEILKQNQSSSASSSKSGQIQPPASSFENSLNL